MVNILIKDDDAFYRKGLMFFLTDIFHQERQRRVNFMTELTAENVMKSDIVIFSFCKGESGTCFPELHSRKQGIVIGLVDKLPETDSLLPSCYQDVFFVSRQSSLDMLENKIIHAWRRYKKSPIPVLASNCYNCQHKILSPQQMRIMANIYKGKSVADIASELMISDKTVFSHKYLTMQKFNLHSDYELLVFLNRLAMKKLTPNAFREYLEL